AGLEAPSLDVAEREVLVELEPDRRQRRLRFDRQARVRPAAETALEDAHVLEATLAEEMNDPGAVLLLGARAVGGGGVFGLQVERRLRSRLRLEAHRAWQLQRARLELGLRAHIEQHRVEPPLDERDHLRRRDP